MIKLEIKPYCQECEDFKAVVAKKYEIEKGYLGTTISCKWCEACEREKQIKELDDFVNGVIGEMKEVNA